MTDNNLDLINVLSDDDLDRVHRHLIMMRAVHKALRYDVTDETSRIEVVEAEQRKRAADELIHLAEADQIYDHYRDQG